MHILVTGGTGTLGRHVVGQLSRSGHEVSVLTRRTALPADSPPARVRTGDLASGRGLSTALAGVEAVIHCASNPKDLRAHVDVAGTRNLIAAARSGPAPHITYISIVGCDQIPVSYYKAKRRAEQLIERSGLSWSILRATQFHDLLFQILRAGSKPPVAVIPKAFRFQPVASADVAARLISVTTDGVTGRCPDVGGPEQADVGHWLDLYLATISSRKRVLAVPVPGRIGAAFRAGKNTVTDGDRGTATFEQFLASTLQVQ